ncbi:MAG: amidase [Oscillospiraceae bacterium]
MEDITMLSMKKVSVMLQNRELSPVDLVEECLARIEKLQPELNAFVYINADEAREAAHIAEKEINAGNYKGKMHGIPIALKDLFYTKGIPTTAGSHILKDFVPNYNGTVVQRLLDAGAILLGKTNTQEFAIGPTSEDSIFGPTHNPWNSKKIPGGSSGGSAAAIATGINHIQQNHYLMIGSLPDSFML